MFDAKLSLAKNYGLVAVCVFVHLQRNSQDQHTLHRLQRTEGAGNCQNERNASVPRRIVERNCPRACSQWSKPASPLRTPKGLV